MENNVILNKSATIEHCIQRIHEEYDGHEDVFDTRVNASKFIQFPGGSSSRGSDRGIQVS